jgi:hypothetical protein
MKGKGTRVKLPGTYFFLLDLMGSPDKMLLLATSQPMSIFFNGLHLCLVIRGVWVPLFEIGGCFL